MLLELTLIQGILKIGHNNSTVQRARERMNERVSRRASGASERMSERASGPLLTSRFKVQTTFFYSFVHEESQLTVKVDQSR